MTLHKELTHSQAVHRRRELGEARQDTTLMNQKILERLKARDRLRYIESLLTPDRSPLSVLSGLELEKTKAELEIEQIWLKFKIGMITQTEQQRELSKKFDDLEKGKPDVYAWLVDVDSGQSRAQQIRGKVIPPIRISGYHTKR